VSAKTTTRTKTAASDADARRELSAELIERARGLAGFLNERAPETEAMRQVSPAVVEALVQAELLSLGTPVALGGHDVDLDTVFEVCYELGRGCMSTAWCLQIWTLHSWFIGYMASSEGQEEIFANGPDAIISSSYNPSGAVVEAADGGCLLSGRWGFSSGVDHASWLLLGAKVPGAADRPAQSPLLLFVRREHVSIEDDWYTLGLKGTGSKSVVITEPVFVPERLYLDLKDAENGSAKTLVGRASYAHPSDATLGFVMAAAFLGAARATLDDFSEDMRVREDSFTRASKSDRASIQMRIGESAAEIDASLYLARSALREMLEAGDRGETLTRDQRATYLLHQVYNVELARRAVARLFEISGTAGMYTSSPMLRRFCDITTGAKHFAMRWDERTESYGRGRMGLEPNATRPG
jgi:alkylation response protein AidB-like acyl-CoA dehydrogenase